MDREDKKHIIFVFAFAAVALVFGIYAARQAKAEFARQVAEEVRQEAQAGQQGQQEAGQQARTGSVTIHTTDGEVWGYYGTITIIQDGSGGSDMEIDMNGAWLVGTTDKTFLPEPGWETGAEE